MTTARSMINRGMLVFALGMMLVNLASIAAGHGGILVSVNALAFAALAGWIVE